MEAVVFRERLCLPLGLYVAADIHRGLYHFALSVAVLVADLFPMPRTTVILRGLYTILCGQTAAEFIDVSSVKTGCISLTVSIFLSMN